MWSFEMPRLPNSSPNSAGPEEVALHLVLKVLLPVEADGAGDVRLGVEGRVLVDLDDPDRVIVEVVLHPLRVHEHVLGVVRHGSSNCPEIWSGLRYRSSPAERRAIVAELMERAPLRPVPARPAGPVDPAAAIREVGAALPALAAGGTRLRARGARRPAAAAGGRAARASRSEELGALLAAARKELRQTITPLAGSGWCERAEGLISDRLDGAVRRTDARRLDVHLRNCPRCVEHERRLVQATDALLAGVAPPAPRRGRRCRRPAERAADGRALRSRRRPPS